MLPEQTPPRDLDERPRDAPLEGDEGEVEIRRDADVGKAILETRIEDVKRASAVTLPVDATVAKALEVMRKKKVGAVMVVSQSRPRRLVGILTERDLLNRVLPTRATAGSASTR